MICDYQELILVNYNYYNHEQPVIVCDRGISAGRKVILMIFQGLER
jgi:hypothetical protein